MARRVGRILAFQGIYAWGAVGQGEFGTIEDILSFSWADSPIDEKTAAFARLLAAGTIEHSEEIDTLIKKHLQNWDFDRVNRVDLAILRMSVYSLLYNRDIHPTIVINEAVDLAKEFSGEDSFKFVNAVLDTILKETICAEL
ncbi:MAG: transcription antitermination factor NusB [Spirochaetaceae bacterium]|nr:transcription antitermination factor NusB [Spirochaetaceae bacterium]